MRRTTAPNSALVLASLLAATSILAGCDRQVGDDASPVAAAATNQGSRPTVGLMSTLPVYWPEGGALSALEAGDAPRPWVRTVLEGAGDLRPLDTLDPAALADLDVLLLAQPRMLTPAENVALDDWVQAGGRALVFADPLLGGESAYPLGDPRRPQDVALLDPILARWGMNLLAPVHDTALRTVSVGAGAPLPVVTGGRLVLRSPAGGGEARCALTIGGLIADCRIGAGRAVVVADATLLERGFESDDSPGTLTTLLGMVRERAGDHAGATGE